jgi:hypothetical protein
MYSARGEYQTEFLNELHRGAIRRLPRLFLISGRELLVEELEQLFESCVLDDIVPDEPSVQFSLDQAVYGCSDHDRNRPPRLLFLSEDHSFATHPT